MKSKKVAKHIVKRYNTFYANFTNNCSSRISKSLGKDLALAKVELAKLKANVEIQNIQPGTDIPPTVSGKGFRLAVNEFILSEFADKKIANARMSPQAPQPAKDREL